jgi:antitoxin (DNA-binding transcriptional repressor) of toxin-antitoxin stability system
MRRNKTYALRFSAAAVALSLALIAFGSGINAATATFNMDTLAELGGQIGMKASKLSGRSLDMLGISSMSCNCTFVSDSNERLWLFHAEPKIKGVDRSGPSNGKLKKGDVLVAIDGKLITTRQGGVRFANLRAGEPVELTVRRRFSTRLVAVIPRAVPESEEPFEFALHRSGNTDSLTFDAQPTALTELARSIEELSKRAAAIGKGVGSMGVPPESGSSSYPELNIDFGESMPRGWIGFGLLFNGSICQRESDEPAQWRFKSSPSIRSVQPGSPADQAGLQVNDVLVEIDGLKLNSRKGGDRFSRMEPGQIVEWRVRRGAKTFTVTTRAGVRP